MVRSSVLAIAAIALAACGESRVDGKISNVTVELEGSALEFQQLSATRRLFPLLGSGLIAEEIRLAQASPTEPTLELVLSIDFDENEVAKLGARSVMPANLDVEIRGPERTHFENGRPPIVFCGDLSGTCTACPFESRDTILALDDGSLRAQHVSGQVEMLEPLSTRFVARFDLTFEGYVPHVAHRDTKIRTRFDLDQPLSAD
jgi:hypothetical protein